VAVAGSADGPLFEDSGIGADQDALEAYRRHALEVPGDVASGYRLFQDQHRLACVRCHRITTARGLVGERVGPELDGIGDRYDRAELITSILEPSSRIASGYTAERVWTRDGRNYQGQVLSETRTELVLVDAGGEQHRLRREDVEGRSPMRASIMPDGYQALMSRQELADLVAFLESLKGGGAEPESEDP
jgi:putative heme-binding domain-containing protein